MGRHPDDTGIDPFHTRDAPHEWKSRMPGHHAVNWPNGILDCRHFLFEGWRRRGRPDETRDVRCAAMNDGRPRPHLGEHHHIGERRHPGPVVIVHCAVGMGEPRG